MRLFKNSNGDIDIPYFIFDKGTGLIFLNSAQTVEGLTIFLNFPLYRLFDSLPFQRSILILITQMEEQEEHHHIICMS
jgi:hypothetical protein